MHTDPFLLDECQAFSIWPEPLKIPVSQSGIWWPRQVQSRGPKQTLGGTHSPSERQTWGQMELNLLLHDGKEGVLHHKGPCELLSVTISPMKKLHFYPLQDLTLCCCRHSVATEDTSKRWQPGPSLHLPFQNVVSVQNILTGFTTPNICSCWTQAGGEIYSTFRQKAGCDPVPCLRNGE